MKDNNVFNDMDVSFDENNQITDYVLYALGLKDQAELEKLYKDLIAGKEVETEMVQYDYDDIVDMHHFNFL